MNEDAVRAAAKLLADAWRDMTTIEALPPGLRPRNFEQAYAIQDEMAALISPFPADQAPMGGQSRKGRSKAWR